MNGYSDPPITFGSSGGLVWPLRAAARGGGGGGGGGAEDPAASMLAATRRPRAAPSHAALRLHATRPPETLAPCGRRWDPREWGERGLRGGSGGGSGGVGCGGSGGGDDDAAHAQNLVALASYSFQQDRRRDTRRDRRGATNTASDDDNENQDADGDDDEDEAAARARDRDPDAPPNPRLEREEREARAALLHGHCPLGGGLYKLNPVEPHSLKGTRFQPLSLSSEKLVSKFAFNFNVYRYTSASRDACCASRCWTRTWLPPYEPCDRGGAVQVGTIA
jgi:hypothetical protein